MPPEALAFILAREGVHLERGDTGYVNNPNDPGGATNYGITQGTFSAWLASQGLPSRHVRSIRYDEVHAIYERNYWRDGKCDRIADSHPKLALAHMDAGVNHGLVQAAKFLQRAVHVTADGVIGPVTLGAVAEADEARAVSRYLLQRAAFYRTLAERRPASREFLFGWLARLRWVARATGVPIDASFEENDADRVHT